MRFSFRPDGLGLLVVVTLVIHLSGCARTEAPSCDLSQAAIAAPLERIIASDNARDLAAVLSFYTEDVIWLPPSGEVLNGKAAIRSRYEALFSVSLVSLASEIVEVRGEGTMGYVRGYTHGTLTALAGGEVAAVNDKFMAIVRCENGTWRVSHLMWSPRDQSQ